jgi:lipopolysaccharide/colanic/teichoic acid biosynthesis glycosyltransferase
LVTLAATSDLTSPARGATRAQRCFDLLIAILALPVIAIIGGLIAVAIYVDSPGPVIYRSRRVGRQGRPFDMLKFRKMRREAGSQPITLEEDERFTPIGRFLAATRLDELPQVWNVLRGEMRLVGPRPELECFVAEFAEEYAQILTVVPGITGPSQVRFVDERQLLTGEDPETTYRTHVLPLKIELDLQYARSHSLIGDLRIILATLVLPVRLLVARLRSGGMRLALWIPAAAAAVALALVFLLTSSHLS